MFPETAGKPLEEIEEMFALGIPAWKTHGGYSVGRQMETGELDSEKQIRIRQEEVENVPASAPVEKTT